MDKLPINFYVKTITPVHIGAAQEQHLKNGVDYIQDKGQVYFIDEKKVLQDKKLEDYVNELSKGNIKNLLKPNFKQYASEIINVSGSAGTEIKKHISNPMTGTPYIPGTSLKGALRSVLVNKAGGAKSFNGKTKEPFGSISQDGFRYMIVGDTFFDDSSYFNTKIFKLFKNGNSFEGGWKNHFKDHRNEGFKINKFTTAYECIPTDRVGACRIVLNGKGYNDAVQVQKRRDKPILRKSSVLKEALKSKQNLFRMIHAYTEQYLNAEIDFFNKYSTKETKTILVELERLKKLNTENSPVLRVGQGSGFHSITGNHIHPMDHLIDSIGHRGRGRKNHKDSAKTRKLAFAVKDRTTLFYPMGFIQLLGEDEYKKIEAQIKKARMDREKKEENERLEAERIQKEKQRKEEEAKKPQWIKMDNLHKRRTTTIDGIVKSSRHGKITFTPCVDEFKDKTFEANFQAKLDVGTIIQIEAKITNAKKLIIEGRPNLKNI